MSRGPEDTELYYVSLAPVFTHYLRSLGGFLLANWNTFCSDYKINGDYILKKIKHYKMGLVDCTHFPCACPRGINTVDKTLGLYFQIIYVK